MVNFDTLFIEFAKSRVKDKSDIDRHSLDALYNQFTVTPNQALDGLSPIKYIEGLSVNELIELLKVSQSEIIIDRLKTVGGAQNAICDLIESTSNQSLIYIGIEILLECGYAEPLSVYLSYIKQNELNSDLLELMVDRLKENAQKIADELFEELSGCDERMRTIIAEILVNAERDERTFKLLVELLLSQSNMPLYVSYMGQYGDERAVNYLYPLLDKCNYADYMEIKNVIERLGGLVDDELRDFTEDVIYRKLKGLDN